MQNQDSNPKARLFVDMDGTLAEFKIVDTLETLYEPGYFANLKPNQNVLNSVKRMVAENPGIEVHILSSVLSDSQYALAEKNQWLDRYLPEVKSRFFPPCGTDKKEYIPGGIRESDWLLDDYTNNLCLWQPPGRGIKLLNGINHTNGTWNKDRLRFDKSASELAENIVGIISGGIIITDERPQDRSNSVFDHYKKVAKDNGLLRSSPTGDMGIDK